MFTKSRIRRGQSSIELVAGLMFLIPIILFAIDIATIFMGSTLNNSVCRDAARAAAGGPPSVLIAKFAMNGQPTPQERAKAVVSRNLKSTGAIQLDPNPVVTENVNAASLPSPPFGGVVNGTVTAQTSVDVYTPFLVGRVIGKTPIRLTTSQTFPYTWVMSGKFP